MRLHFNELKPWEAERLALLLEEMGEAQQAIGKILRHGYESRNPLIDDGPTNRESLERELGDVMLAYELMAEAGDIDTGSVITRTVKKRITVRAYLHHQGVAPNTGLEPSAHDYRALAQTLVERLELVLNVLKDCEHGPACGHTTKTGEVMRCNRCFAIEFGSSTLASAAAVGIVPGGR